MNSFTLSVKQKTLFSQKWQMMDKSNLSMKCLMTMISKGTGDILCIHLFSWVPIFMVS